MLRIFWPLPCGNCHLLNKQSCKNGWLKSYYTGLSCVFLFSIKIGIYKTMTLLNGTLHHQHVTTWWQVNSVLISLLLARGSIKDKTFFNKPDWLQYVGKQCFGVISWYWCLERLLMHIRQSHMPCILQWLFNNVYFLQMEKLYNNDSLPQPALANPLPSQLYRLRLEVSQDSSRSSCQT